MHIYMMRTVGKQKLFTLQRVHRKGNVPSPSRNTKLLWLKDEQISRFRHRMYSVVGRYIQGCGGGASALE